MEPAMDHDPRLRPAAQRLLFVSSVTDGGSGRSQRELAAALRASGRDVRFLVDAGDRAAPQRRVLEELTDATARLRANRLGGVVDRVRRQVGARTRSCEIEGLPHEVSIAPENAFEPLVQRWRPDVVVVSSISRVPWRAIRQVCRRRGIPTVLYLREAVAIGHLTAGLRADALLANSGTLVDDAGRLGLTAELVPSVVHTRPMEQPPTGEVVLIVNPIASHGLHMVEPLATARPDIPIVLQESWPIDRDDRAEIDRLVGTHANVGFRAFDPRPEQLFRDARLLLSPHRIDNRPRTILEAQANGLPVVATDLPGLVEAVGPGGSTVSLDADPREWIAAVAAIWDDDGARQTLSDRASIHAARPDVHPDEVAARFTMMVDDVVTDVGRSERQNSSISPSANRN